MTSSACTQLPPWSTRSHRAQTRIGSPGGRSRRAARTGECASVAEAVVVSRTASRLRMATRVTRAALVDGGSDSDLVEVWVTSKAPSGDRETSKAAGFAARPPSR
jgi:hypothetical protein